jgi:hypothetical protein
MYNKYWVEFHEIIIGALNHLYLLDCIYNK